MPSARCRPAIIWKSSRLWAEVNVVSIEIAKESWADSLRIGSHSLASRLIVGTGKYANYGLMAESLEASGADCITVAVRRERLVDSQGRNLLDYIDTNRYVLLPNTAGCFS